MEIQFYNKSEELPSLLKGDFFHSQEWFRIIEKVPGKSPIMAVAYNSDGKIMGQMVVVVFRKSSLFPPYIYTHARVYGSGIYASDDMEQEIFPQLLHTITHRLNRRLCFCIEFCNLPKKMYGYRSFRNEGFIPLPWQEIHNSLHSKVPEERLNEKQKARIEKLHEKGVETHIAQTEEDLIAFHRLLKNYYSLKIKHDLPTLAFLKDLQASKNGDVFLTTYKNKLIGGCSCIYNRGNAYLWHLAAKRKSYALYSPNLMTVWGAIKYAKAKNYAHIYFMNVGFPWKKNPKREFFLNFGGKPVAKYRWFRFYSKFINRIVGWIYKE